MQANDQQSLCGETPKNTHCIQHDVTTTLNLTEQQNTPTQDSLHAETDIIGMPDDDMIDKYNAAEGLLLLGTDVSSADDSQTALDTNMCINKDATNDESDADSDKTIPLSSLPAETSSPPHTPPPVKSPKKGVLNFRQIGIKRHQPVDSSDPSVIGSPPGSPVSQTHTNKQKRRRSSTSVPNQTKGKGRPKPPNPAKKNTNKTNNKPSTAVRSPERTQAQRDQDGKYSIKCMTINGTTYYCCSYCKNEIRQSPRTKCASRKETSAGPV